MKRIGLDVTPEQHTAIKIYSATHGISVKDACLEALKKIMGDELCLKKTTKKR